MRRAASALLLLALAALAAPSGARPEDRAALLEGVRAIAAPGVPGGLSVFGPDAFPVAAGPIDGGAMAPVAAAARLGEGRVVAFGHDGYFGAAALRAADTGRLLLNAVRWLAPPGRELSVAVLQAPDLLAHLRAAGIPCAAAEPEADLGRFSVVALTHAAMRGGLPARLAAWARGGGGLLLASTGWGWSQITGRPIAEHPGSLLAAPAGLTWNAAMLRPPAGGAFSAAGDLPELLHAGRALSAIERGPAPAGEAARQALSSCLLAAASLPAVETAFRNRLRRVVGQVPVPTRAAPVGPADPRAALSLALAVTDARQAPVADVRELAPAADFPGAVPPDASRAARRVAVDASVPGWASTGLYVPAGSPVTLSLPFAALKGAWSIRVGAHSDTLWHLSSWQRAPEITRVFPVTGPVTRVASAFGGLLYVVVPQDGGPGPVEVRVDGAVEAPFFRLGETSVEDWRASRRARPAPWAELAGRRVIFTVPSEAVRELDDPASLMALWDRLVEAEEKLAARPPRRTPERIVADRQISAGYMHAGYPIMTPIDDSMRLALDERRLRAGGSWGHLHELGHNLQERDWTFDGTGEVTCNVLAIYAYEKVLGLPFDSGHPEIRDRKKRAERVERHVAAGAPFEKWKSDPFLALTMYIELIEGFGWGPLEKVFAEYRALPAGERPRTDDERRDQWLVRVSRAAGRDLSPFFRRWGVPVTDAARSQVRHLPEWSRP